MTARPRALAGAAAFLLAAGVWSGCQDRTGGPELWTVDGVHQGLGLRAGHGSLACGDCHREASFQPVSPDCAGCHREAYERAADPDHGAEGFGTDCAACHDSEAWRPAKVQHEEFGFPLDGAHARLVCRACHDPGPFTRLPADCWSCHQDGFEAADPDHAALGFGRDCETCHTVAAWSPARFDHDATGFPLDGAHRTPGCAACHVDSRFAGTPTDCYACHADAEPPDHFGPACADCHTAAAWEPAVFDHEPLFPLRAGGHRRYRDDCSACHLQRPNWGSFTCTDCHDGKHDRARTDRKHREVRRYQYVSAACLDCHPSGREKEGEGED